MIPMILGVLLALPPHPTGDDALLTTAERTEFSATSRYADVMALVERLARASPVVQVGELGRSVEGRSLPLLILADPPVRTAEEARRSGKLVVLAFGNIHAGEVCGKEALLMLAREVAGGQHRSLLERLVVIFCPILNADGNERVSKDNRPGQNGPRDGMGQRHNAQDLDLNRDYVKLESPEVQALVRLLNEWDPAVIIDTHTTNGSLHRYTITYDGPRNPAGDAAVIEYVQQEFLPAVTRNLEQSSGYKSFFYGNFDEAHTRWETYPDEPRYGTPYGGLRNRITILSEAYAYAPFRDRVLATQAFVLECLRYAADHHDRIAALLRQADERTVAAGLEPKPADLVAIQSKMLAFDEPVPILGYEERMDEGKLVAGEPRQYVVQHFNRFVGTRSVRRPFAYLLPAMLTSVADKLRQHGIQVQRLAEAYQGAGERYRITQIKRAEQAFQGHRLAELTATVEATEVNLPAGTLVVRTAQPLGTLAVYLLEPESADGLASWNFFNGAMEAGQFYPVFRIPAAAKLITTD